MSGQIKKITVNVPVRVLQNAVRVTGKGVTLTVIEGLEELDRRAKRTALRALRGKVRFELDLEDTRWSPSSAAACAPAPSGTG